MSLNLDPDLHAQLGQETDARFDDPQNTAPEPVLSDWQPPDDAAPLIRVTAVLVAHDGAAFLPRTLDALEAQSRPPERLVAVDAGSVDGSADLLALATRRLLRLNRDTSFGDAVQAALAALDANALEPADDPRTGDRRIDLAAAGVDWLWLLHDDSAPAPDALERLIEVVDGGPSIGIAGCKQVSWDDAKRLLDVGFTTSRLGARVTGIDDDDVDQGQHDQRSDVLAVGTAGMLVRRDVWDRLGGPDPVLAHARDDLDLCRRAHLAGLRVVVVPKAVMAHAAATASGRRGRAGEGRASWALRDRRAAIHLRLAAAPLLLLPFLITWLAAAAVLRALVRLALKQPELAGAELAAFGLTLTRPMAWIRARRRGRARREVSGRDFRRLLAGPRLAFRQRHDAFSAHLRQQEEAWASPTEADRDEAVARADDGAGLGEGTLSVSFDDERERPARPPVRRIGFVIAGLVAATGLVGLRLLLSGTGVPLGPALIPAPETAAQLWALANSDWRPTGLGLPAVADPFDAVLAAIAWPLGGSTRVAAEVLLLGALPLSALSAWWAAGGVTRSRALRAWAAFGWAAAPSLLLAVAAGRLAAIVVHLALPPAALALARTIGARPAPAPGDRMPAPAAAGRARGSISAASGAGLLITLLVAAEPSLALPALVALLVTAAVSRLGRGLLIWTAAVPAVLLLPWWMAVARHPLLLLAEPGGASAAEPGTALWPVALWPADPALGQHGPVQRLAGVVANLTSPGDPALWLRGATVVLALPLLALGLVALLRRGRARAPGALWLVGLAGLAVAELSPVLRVQAEADGTRHGWPGAGVSLLTLAVLAAALTRLDGTAGRLRARSLGARHWLAVGTGIVALLAPTVTLAAWAVEGWSASPDRWVHRGSPDVLPAVAAAEAQGPAATRTLVLRLTPKDVRWSLYRAGGPRLGQDSAASLASPSSTGRAGNPLLPVIGGLLSNTGADQRSRLADLDIGSILLLAPATEAAVGSLDSTPGLVQVATPNGGVLWRVELDGVGGGTTRPARVRVLSVDGRVVDTLPSRGTEVRARLKSGPAGRQLVLSERADPGWRAWLNGTRLTPARHAGWAQAFTLPRSGGVVTVKHVTTGAGVIDLTRLGVIGLALLVAVPLPGRRPRLRPPSNPMRSGAAAGPIETVGRRTRLAPPPAEVALDHLESLGAVERPQAEPEFVTEPVFVTEPEFIDEPQFLAATGLDAAAEAGAKLEPDTEPEPATEGTS